MTSRLKNKLQYKLDKSIYGIFIVGEFARVAFNCGYGITYRIGEELLLENWIDEL